MKLTLQLINFSYSDPGGTLKNKLNNLISLFSRKKSFAFQKKESKSCGPDYYNNNHSVRVTYHTWPLSMKKTFDQHMSILFD